MPVSPVMLSAAKNDPSLLADPFPKKPTSERPGAREPGTPLPNPNRTAHRTGYGRGLSPPWQRRPGYLVLSDDGYLLALPDSDRERMQRIPAQHFDGNGLARAITCQHYLQIFRVGHDVTIESDQDVSQQDTTLLCRTVLIDFDY